MSKFTPDVYKALKAHMAEIEKVLDRLYEAHRLPELHASYARRCTFKNENNGPPEIDGELAAARAQFIADVRARAVVKGEVQIEHELNKLQALRVGLPDLAAKACVALGAVKPEVCHE